MKSTILLLAIVLLSGCSEARRMEKKRLKAEALVKEAIGTYPDIIKPVITTDTITIKKVLSHQHFVPANYSPY